MKLIITESQYKILVENDKPDFDTFLKIRYPNIGDLKINRIKSSSRGLTRRYYDPKTNEIFFTLIIDSPSDWKSGVGEIGSDAPNRLYVNTKIYNRAKQYTMWFENDILKWFNETYGENAQSTFKGGVHKI